MALYYTRRQLNLPDGSIVEAEKVINENKIPPDMFEQLVKDGMIVPLADKDKPVLAEPEKEHEEAEDDDGDDSEEGEGEGDDSEEGHEGAGQSDDADESGSEVKKPTAAKPKTKKKRRR